MLVAITVDIGIDMRGFVYSYTWGIYRLYYMMFGLALNSSGQEGQLRIGTDKRRLVIC